jgi:hypothetical protein
MMPAMLSDEALMRTNEWAADALLRVALHDFHGSQ